MTTAPSLTSLPPDEPRWGPLDVLIAVAISLVLGGVLAAFVMAAMVGGFDQDALQAALEDPTPGQLAALVVVQWLGFLLWPTIATMTRGARSFVADLGLAIRGRDVGLGVLGGIGVLVLGYLLTVAYEALAGRPPPDNAGFLEQASPTGPEALLLFVVIAIGTPVVEELFFRGFVLRAFAKRWGLPVGMIGSSVLFGVFHVTGQGVGDLWLMFVLSLYGYVLALLVVRGEGRLGPAVIAHAINNGLVVAVTMT